MSSKLTDLTSGTTAATDEVYVNKAGADRKVTAQDLVDLAKTKFILASGGITTDTTTARTLAAGDNGKVLYFTNGSAITVTTLTGLGAGFSCTLIQGGAGQITVAQGSSTTLVGYGGQYKSAGQYAVMGLVCPVANTFVCTGNTTA